MDFVADQLIDGRHIRILTVIDNFTRKSLGLYVAQHITGFDVADMLDGIINHRGKTARIQVDNGSDISSLNFVQRMDQDRGAGHREPRRY